VERQVSGAAFYRHVDVSSRVEGASPHRLVALLLDEALEQMAVIATAYQRGHAAHAAHARAQAILHALESDLDYRRGGETASLMARVYRETRRCLSQAAENDDPFWCKQAGATLSPIAEAWTQIGTASIGQAA
jgi:flagellar secretion chaperone FliS